MDWVGECQECFPLGWCGCGTCGGGEECVEGNGPPRTVAVIFPYSTSISLGSSICKSCSIGNPLL